MRVCLKVSLRRKVYATRKIDVFNKNLYDRKPKKQYILIKNMYCFYYTEVVVFTSCNILEEKEEKYVMHQNRQFN